MNRSKPKRKLTLPQLEQLEKNSEELRLLKLKMASQGSPVKELSKEEQLKIVERAYLREKREKEDYMAKTGRDRSREIQQKEKNFTNSQAFNAFRKYAPDFRRIMWKWTAYMTLHMGNLFAVNESRLDEAGPWKLIATGLGGFILFYAYYVNNEASFAAWQASGLALPETVVLLGIAGYLGYRYRKKLGI